MNLTKALERIAAVDGKFKKINPYPSKPNQYYWCISGKVEFPVGGESLMEWDILGAICERIELSDLLWQCYYSNGSWRFRINLTQGNEWLFKDSRQSACHAAALTYLEALESACSECISGYIEIADAQFIDCPSCEGTGIHSDPIGAGLSNNSHCGDCKGTGKQQKVVTAELADCEACRGIGDFSDLKGIGLAPNMYCPECNGTGKQQEVSE